MKPLKIAAFIFAQLIICSVILELVCYLFLVNSTNPLYRARRILQYDAELGWMQKPDLDTTFDKKLVVTNSQGFRIQPKENSPLSPAGFLTLGPSSAFGWGVNNEETYTAIVAKHFNTQALNASGIGHSILQGIRVWNQKIANKNFSHVLIAYGVNDLDKFRFFDSSSINDKTFFLSEPLGLKMDKLHLPSNFITALSLTTREVANKNSCTQLMSFAQRVPWEDYQEALSKMVTEMKEKKIIPVLVGTPFYLKRKNPKYTSALIESTYAEVSELAKKSLCKQAHEKLKLAKSYEPDHIYEQVLLFNQNLKSFAEKNGLVYIDTFQILMSSDPGNNFFDPVHPSKTGHQMIADQVIKSLTL